MNALRQPRIAALLALSWILTFLAVPALHALRHDVGHHHEGAALTVAAAHHGHGHAHGGHHRWVFAPRGPWSGKPLPSRLTVTPPSARIAADDAPGSTLPIEHGTGSAAHLSATLASGAAPAIALDGEQTAALPAFAPARALAAHRPSALRPGAPPRGPPSTRA